MASFSTHLQLDPPLIDQRYGIAPRPIDAWQLAVIDWGTNQKVGHVNRAEAIAGVPAGLTINDARIAPKVKLRPKRQISIESAVVPLQSVKVKFQDKNRALSVLIAEKRANGIGLRGKVMRLYEWEAGTNVDLERNLVGTYRLDDRTSIDGYKTLVGLDIRRQLKTEIFEPETYRLVNSITDSDTTLTINVPYDTVSDHPLPTLIHNQRYSSDPSEEVMYIKMPSGEVVKLPKAGLNPLSNSQIECSNCKRGALNTAHLIESVEVDASTESDNLPELHEWIYLEETLPDLTRMITIGTSFDGRPVPAHWTGSIDSQWIDSDSLLYAAPELASLPLRAENYGKVTIKELIETEILPFVPASMLANAQGAIQLRRITTIRPEGPDRHRFDDSVLDRRTMQATATKVSHIKKAVAIRAGWDARTEEFTRPIFFTDAGTSAANDDTADADVLIFDSKLMHSSIQSDEQIRRFLPAMAEHYLGEKMSFGIRAKSTAGIVDVGQRVFVSLDGVVDDSTLTGLAPDINRSLLVTSMDPGESGTMYQFTGTSGLAGEYYDTLTQPSLALEDYEVDAVSLADELPAGAIVESGGIYYIQPGQWEVSFRKKYKFMDGPLYHTTGSELVCAPGEEGPMFLLYIPHAWHSDSPRTVVTVGKGGGGGGAPGKAGAAGFAIPTTGTGSMRASGFYDNSGSGDIQVVAWEFYAFPGVQSESYSTGDVPSISLSYNDGALVGLPTDLSGYAGCGGGTTSIYSEESFGGTAIKHEPGGVGAAKSAGVMIVHRGATMAPDARFVVDGEAGSTPQPFSKPGSAQSFAGSTFYNQAGSGSGPGFVALVSDGPYTPIDVSAHVLAHPGETFYHDVHMAEPSIARVRDTDYHSHYRALDHTINLAGICSKWLYLPKPSTVQERPLFGIDLAFENQRDNKIVLIPNSGILPSDGNPGDMTMTRTDLSGTSRSPTSAYVMNNSYEWVLYDWENDGRRTAYLNLLQSHRDFGGIEYFNQEDRPAEGTFTPGSLWRQPSTKITWSLEQYGPPDKFVMVDETQVSDNRFKDPEFTDLMLGAHDWVIRDNIYTLPTFPLSLSAVALGPTIISVEFDGGVSSSAGDYPLASITGTGGVVDSDTQITITFNEPADTSSITGYEVRRDGALVGSLSVGVSSYTDTGLTGSTTYTYTVRAVNATERGPDSVAFSITTDPTVSAANTLDPVTNLTAQVYSQTALELFWSPPVDPGVGDGYEIFRDGALISSPSGITTSSHFDSGLNIATTYLYEVRVVGAGESSDRAPLLVITNA